MIQKSSTNVNKSELYIYKSEMVKRNKHIGYIFRFINLLPSKTKWDEY